METRSKKRKRQRLMMQSYIPPQRPNPLATFESLNDDTLTTVLEFVGNKSYSSFGGINKHCRETYLNTNGMTKETFVFGYGSLAAIQDEAKFISEVKIEREKAYEEDEFDDYEVFDHELFYPLGKGVVYHNRRDVFEWALQERKYDVLNGICQIAAGEGRIHLLDEVLNNVEDWDGDGDDTEDKWYVFDVVDQCAACHGKLSVLKWYHTKRLLIREDECESLAARNGHLDIIQWLQEERGLQLHGGLYSCANSGGHLHVLKWLRERQVPWHEKSFKYAAEKGNLEVLQFLHDEGCPWLDNLFVSGVLLKPEVIDWCRSNGYGNRIIFGDNDDY